MKDRHTPIERVPHLGFKQINLFKIYKVVEKLGAYELVTGRRLWKNVYDMLGGSPGSTSAATCTRRHYERLVLPYVRHLKGEDDKPLPPVQPRKQYKVSREPKGTKGNGAGAKKRAKKEKLRDQILPEKLTPDAASAPQLAGDPQRPEQPEGCLSLPNACEAAESQAPNGCHGNCRSHGCSETYTRLFSSFYIKGNHGIMSPLAKKKLLAQVSKEESLRAPPAHLSHCPEYRKTRVRETPASDAEAAPKHPPATSLPPGEGQTPVREGDSSTGPAGSSKTSEGEMKAPPGLTEGPLPQKAEGGCSGGQPRPGLPLVRGYFPTSRGEVVKPISCHPLRGPGEYYGGFQNFPEVSAAGASAYQRLGSDGLLSRLPQKKQEGAVDEPEDLRQKPSQPLPSWRGEGRQQGTPFQVSSPGGKRGSSPFPHAKASWVPPVANLAKVSPQVLKSGGQSVSQAQASGLAHKKRAMEEERLLHGKRLKAVAPFVKEVQSGNRPERSASPSSQQGVVKPKAAVPSSGFPIAPVPQLRDMYKGTMLRLPVHFSAPGEHLKGQPASLTPSLSISPFIIPAFPTPLLTASLQPSDLCQPLVPYPTSYDSTLRHRLYPVSTWHSQPAYASPPVSAFHRNTKL